MMFKDSQVLSMIISLHSANLEREDSAVMEAIDAKVKPEEKDQQATNCVCLQQSLPGSADVALQRSKSKRRSDSD